MADLDYVPAELHRRVLARIGDGHDPATMGRRSIAERHPPGTITGMWVECHGPHGSEGGEYDWPCADYRDAAGEAAELLPVDPCRWTVHRRTPVHS